MACWCSSGTSTTTFALFSRAAWAGSDVRGRMPGSWPFSFAFALPLALHPVAAVAAVYAVTAIVIGVVLGVVFQLAHCVELADFPLELESGRMATPWAVHQVETSVDFARDNRVASWLVGGLNFQIEHHLFARICHVNYPAIAPLVEQICDEFGVRYKQNATVLSALRSHYRWLRAMGREDASVYSTAFPA